MKTKNKSEFSKRKAAKNGLNCWCRSCQKEYAKTYYKAHRREYLTINKIYYETHRKECLAASDKYNKENPEQHMKCIKRWRKENPEKEREHDAREHAKRKRNLGFTKLVENPFNILEPIAWHHIDDELVTPIPKDIHQHFSGGDTTEHRELLEFVVLQITETFKKE